MQIAYLVFTSMTFIPLENMPLLFFLVWPKKKSLDLCMLACWGKKRSLNIWLFGLLGAVWGCTWLEYTLRMSTEESCNWTLFGKKTQFSRIGNNLCLWVVLFYPCLWILFEEISLPKSMPISRLLLSGNITLALALALLMFEGQVEGSMFWIWINNVCHSFCFVCSFTVKSTCSVIKRRKEARESQNHIHDRVATQAIWCIQCTSTNSRTCKPSTPFCAIIVFLGLKGPKSKSWLNCD